MDSNQVDVEVLTNQTTKLIVSEPSTFAEVEDATEISIVKVVEELSLDGFSETSMVARVFSRKGCSTSFLKTIFGRMWKFRDSWQVRHLKNDQKSSFFGFTFSSPTDQIWVLERAPWTFTGGFLIGTPWPSSGDWKDATLGSIPLSISINNIPLKLFTKNNLNFWVKMVDPLAEIKWKGTNLDMIRATMNAKVNVPVDTRPCVGLFISFEGKNKWLQFKFAKVPIICYKCGIWGHEIPDCRNKPVAIRHPDDPERKLIQLYGPWLSTNIVGDCFMPCCAKKDWIVEELKEASGRSKNTDVSPESGEEHNPGHLNPSQSLGKDKSKITFYFSGSSHDHKSKAATLNTSVEPTPRKHSFTTTLWNKNSKICSVIANGKKEERILPKLSTIQNGTLNPTTTFHYLLSPKETTQKSTLNTTTTFHHLLSLKETTKLNECSHPTNKYPTCTTPIPTKDDTSPMHVIDSKNTTQPILTTTHPHASMQNSLCPPCKNDPHVNTSLETKKHSNLEATPSRKRMSIKDKARMKTGKKIKAEAAAEDKEKESVGVTKLPGTVRSFIVVQGV